MSDDLDDRLVHDPPLFVCTMCHLNPTPWWETITLDDMRYHVGFDFRPCGPIMTLPANEGP